MTRPAIVVLAGPTAVGKTRLALSLARTEDGEVVGVDSVQVYRGFDIGSAKPTEEELDGVAHHLIDVIDADEPIDAVRYADRADRAIAEIAGRSRLPIVVGGTGLWLRALLRGLLDLPPVDPALRGRLEAEVERHGSPTMHARLAEVDPIGAAAIHPNDALRIVRGLEVWEQTGSALGELRRRHGLGAPRYPGIHLFVDLPDEGPNGLRARIRERVGAMVDAGFEDEVRRLLARYGPDVRPFGSVGYRQMVAHVREGLDAEDTVKAIEKATRIYARRQRTWFSSEPGFEGPTSPARVLSAKMIARVAALPRGGA